MSYYEYFEEVVVLDFDILITLIDGLTFWV